MDLIAEPILHSLSVTFQNSWSAKFHTNCDYSLLVLIISNCENVTGVPAENADFSSSIVVGVVVYLVNEITKSEVRIISVMR